MPSYSRTFRFFFLNWSAVFGIAVAGLFCALISTPLHGQRSLINDTRYEVIDAEEGERRMEHFRRQRLDGDYCFRFVLEHLPSKAKTVRYYGTMWGSWNERGPITRIELSTEPDTLQIDNDSCIEMIFQNGPEPEAWLRRSRKDEFVQLTGDALLEPVLAGIVYTPFDMQMPFLYWDEYKYEGPVRVRTSVAQTFLMLPPEETTNIQGVRIGIDDTYNALRRIEVIAGVGEPRSEFTVESFKQVQEQWIVKRIVLKDNASGDRTRFKVRAASVGLILPETIFLPKKDVSFPVIPESMFKNV